MIPHGWRAMRAAFLAGALSALAMPPLYWLPLAVLGFVALVWLWSTAPGPKIALLRGWAWGLGHFAVGSYWILEAFYVPPADFALIGPRCSWRLAVVLGFFRGLRPVSRRVVSAGGLGGHTSVVLVAGRWRE